MNIGVLTKTGLLIGGLLAVWSIEQGTTAVLGDQTLAPILSILACAILVFFESPRLILVAIPCFALETYLLIMDSSKYPAVRTTTMIVGGLLAYWACRQRKSLRSQISETDMILNKLDAPWALCDRAGNIQRISSKAADLAGSAPDRMLGISFFSKFGGGASKGEIIQKFLRSADLRETADSITLVPSDRTTVTVKASFVPLQTRDGAGVLVICGAPS